MTAGGAYRGAADGVCPRCGAPLSATERGGVSFVECGGCGGAFLSQDAVERVLSDDAARARLAAELPARPRFVESSVRYLPCPRCSRAMNRKVFARVSGVIVDVCKEDGVFFDGGELVAVVGFVDRGGLVRQAALEAREKADRAREARRSHVPVLSHDDGAEQASDLLGLLGELFR